MRKILILTAVILAASFAAYAEEAQIGKDDFISGAISDMFAKIGQYTSGEKSVIIEDYASQPDTAMPLEPKPKDGKAPANGAHW